MTFLVVIWLFCATGMCSINVYYHFPTCRTQQRIWKPWTICSTVTEMSAETNAHLMTGWILKTFYRSTLLFQKKKVIIICFAIFHSIWLIVTLLLHVFSYLINCFLSLTCPSYRMLYPWVPFSFFHFVLYFLFPWSMVVSEINLMYLYFVVPDARWSGPDIGRPQRRESKRIPAGQILWGIDYFAVVH